MKSISFNMFPWYICLLLSNHKISFLFHLCTKNGHNLSIVKYFISRFVMKYKMTITVQFLLRNNLKHPCYIAHFCIIFNLKVHLRTFFIFYINNYLVIHVKWGSIRFTNKLAQFLLRKYINYLHMIFN